MTALTGQTSDVRGAPRTLAEQTRPPTCLPLTLAGVSYDVGSARLVTDLSFELAYGPRTIIMGPNGAGKSLTLRLCHGLIRPTAGSVTWHGRSTGAGCREAMVFQRPVMLQRSAQKNVEYALSVRRVPRRDRRERARAALAEAGLERIAHRPARSLSAGEQQRLALARAWALRPEVLFLDEPTSSLDPAATRAVEELVLAVHRSGTKIVMTTHDLGQARRLADEVIFLHEGRLVERSAAPDFFGGPQTEAASAFIEGRLF